MPRSNKSTNKKPRGFFRWPGSNDRSVVHLSCFDSLKDSKSYTGSNTTPVDGPWQVTAYIDEPGQEMHSINNDSHFILWLAESSSKPTETLISMLQYEVTDTLIKTILQTIKKLPYEEPQPEAQSHRSVGSSPINSGSPKHHMSHSLSESVEHAIREHHREIANFSVSESLREISESILSDAASNIPDFSSCDFDEKNLANMHNVLSTLLLDEQVKSSIEQLHNNALRNSYRQKKINSYLKAAHDHKQELQNSVQLDDEASDDASIGSDGSVHTPLFISQQAEMLLKKLKCVHDLSTLDYEKKLQYTICKSLAAISNLNAKETIALSCILNYLAEMQQQSSPAAAEAKAEEEIVLDIQLDDMYMKRFYTGDKENLIYIAKLLAHFYKRDILQEEKSFTPSLVCSITPIRLSHNVSIISVPLIHSIVNELDTLKRSASGATGNIMEMASQFSKRNECESQINKYYLPLIVAYEVLSANQCIDLHQKDTTDIVRVTSTDPQKLLKPINSYYQEQNNAKKLLFTEFHGYITRDGNEFIQIGRDEDRKLTFEITLKADINKALGLVVEVMKQSIKAGEVKYIETLDSMSVPVYRRKQESLRLQLADKLNSLLLPQEFEIINQQICVKVLEHFQNAGVQKSLIAFLENAVSQVFPNQAYFDSWLQNMFAHEFIANDTFPIMLERCIIDELKKLAIPLDDWKPATSLPAIPSDAFTPSSSQPSSSPPRQSSPIIATPVTPPSPQSPRSSGSPTRNDRTTSPVVMSVPINLAKNSLLASPNHVQSQAPTPSKH